MKEIDRRVMSHEGSGMACGPMSIYAADAEIVVEDEGRKVYLHAQWVDEAGDMILFEATTKSIYDYSVKLNQLEDGELELPEDMDEGDMFDELLAERDSVFEECDVADEYDIEERYAAEYKELVAMLQEQLDKDGFDFNLTTMRSSEDEEEDEE